ncbi:MAG TPA: phosphodiester glycosidase family protein [Verrucomicrobiae bacterium]|nr:phosphodiester glycosidase family protein [Verrucomicrobiae bacterium]
MEKPILFPSFDSAVRISPRQKIMHYLTAAWVAVLIAPLLGAAEFRPVKGEPGLSYKNEKVSSVPWSIHVLRVDRAQKDLALYSAHARDKVLGVSLLAEQTRAIPAGVGRGIAAVNGDFYLRDGTTYPGDPRGLQIVNGELISGPDTVCVWFDAEGNPHLDDVKGDFHVTWADGRKTPVGLNQQRARNKAVLYTPTYGVSTRATGGRELVLEKEGDGPWLPLQASQTYRGRVREVRTNGNTRFVPDTMVLSIAPPLLANIPDLTNGSVLQISMATIPSLQGAKAAIGGGPALLREGKPAITAKTPPPGSSGDYSLRSRYERHPRSAVGWNATHVFLLVVDGRQPRLSEGMKLAELAEFMLSLGCTDGMNLDGGKSAQMWMNGETISSPCQGEDTVANSLIVIRRAR